MHSDRLIAIHFDWAGRRATQFLFNVDISLWD